MKHERPKRVHKAQERRTEQTAWIGKTLETECSKQRFMWERKKNVPTENEGKKEW